MKRMIIVRQRKKGEKVACLTPKADEVACVFYVFWACPKRQLKEVGCRKGTQPKNPRQTVMNILR